MHFSVAALIVLATAASAVPTTPSKREDTCGIYGAVGAPSNYLMGGGNCNPDNGLNGDVKELFTLYDNCLVCEWYR
jgi:hypothetical protein